MGGFSDSLRKIGWLRHHCSSVVLHSAGLFHVICKYRFSFFLLFCISCFIRLHSPITLSEQMSLYWVFPENTFVVCLMCPWVISICNGLYEWGEVIDTTKRKQHQSRPNLNTLLTCNKAQFGNDSLWTVVKKLKHFQCASPTLRVKKLLFMNLMQNKHFIYCISTTLNQITLITLHFSIVGIITMY